MCFLKSLAKSHSFTKLFHWRVCEVALSKTEKKKESPLWVHPPRLEKQVSTDPSQQPLHTDRIPALKPSTWQLINNWLTCFSGEPDDLHPAPGSLCSQCESRQRCRERDNYVVKWQTAIKLLYFTIRNTASWLTMIPALCVFFPKKNPSNFWHAPARSFIPCK